MNRKGIIPTMLKIVPAILILLVIGNVSTTIAYAEDGSTIFNINAASNQTIHKVPKEIAAIVNKTVSNPIISNTIDYNKPPLYLFTVYNQLVFWTDATGDWNNYLPIYVNVKDIKYRNLAGVTVRLDVWHESNSADDEPYILYTDTKKSDKNGEVWFLTNCAGDCLNSDQWITVTATSPISGREAYSLFLPWKQIWG